MLHQLFLKHLRKNLIYLFILFVYHLKKKQTFSFFEKETDSIEKYLK